MNGPPAIAVVIVSKDEPLLQDSLDALREQVDESDAECVVVDASRKRLDHIRLAHPWVRWIDFIGPLGVGITIAHQRNAGVRATRAGIVAFCDSGGIPGENWLAELAAPITEGKADATCGPIYNVDSPFMGTINDLPDGAPVRVTVTANMAVTRSAFDTVGGFDERFACGEDTEFGWRLRDARLRVICAAAATMSMHWGDAKREIIRGRRYGEGTAMLFLTHPDRIAEHVSMWPDLLAYPVWLVGLPISLALIPISWWIPVGWVAFLVVPFVRALRSGMPGAFLHVKWVRTMGFFAGLLRALTNRGVPVLLVGLSDRPDPHAPSQAQLAECGVATDVLDVTHLWAVARLIWRRIRGARIVDVREESSGTRRSSRRLRAALWAADRVGFRIVDWDSGGNDVLARRADAVIVDSPGREDELVRARRVLPTRILTREDPAEAAGPASAQIARRLYESLLMAEPVTEEG